MDIRRWPGGATGRNRTVAWNGMVWTVATAAAVEGFLPQVEACLSLLDRSLADAGTSRSRMLSVTVYLQDMGEKPAFDRMWDAWIGPDPQAWPQRACVGAKLAGGCLVEIVVFAAGAA